jgi:hypothetical protein
VGPLGACPKTTTGLHGQEISRVSPILGPERPATALGSGPVYPMLFFGSAFYKPSKQAGRGSRIIPANQPRTVWDSIMTLWIAPKSFDLSVLVRGQQINGSHRLRFGKGNRPGKTFLRLSEVDAAVQTDGSRVWTGGTWVLSPGCYVLQLDYAQSSKTIVIQIGQARNF